MDHTTKNDGGHGFDDGGCVAAAGAVAGAHSVIVVDGHGGCDQIISKNPENGRADENGGVHPGFNAGPIKIAPSWKFRKDQNGKHIGPARDPAVPVRVKSSLSELIRSSPILASIFISKESTLATILAIVAVTAFSNILALQDSHVGSIALGFGDIVFHPDVLPDDFYHIMFMTLAFVLSILGVASLLRSMMSKPSFMYQALPGLVLASFFLTYGFILDKKVPEFRVTIIGSVHISSFWMVWLGCILLLILTSRLRSVWFDEMELDSNRMKTKMSLE